MSAPKLELVALDVGGTLIPSSGTVSNSTLHTLRGLAAAGVTFALFSELSWPAIRPLVSLLDLGMPLPCVCNHGAHVVWGESGRLLPPRTIANVNVPVAAVRIILNTADRRGLLTQVRQYAPPPPPHPTHLCDLFGRQGPQK